jgi:hypothetical protein
MKHQFATRRRDVDGFSDAVETDPRPSSPPIHSIMCLSDRSINESDDLPVTGQGGHRQSGFPQATGATFQ